jgi:acyl carrier protein
MDTSPADIAALMSSILDVDEIGVDENFFEYGNSLLALRLLATVEQRYGAKIRLLELVRAPTPEQLSALVAADAARTP